VDLQAHPVAEAVSELLGVTGIGDDLPRCRVHSVQRRSRRQRITAGPLSGGDQVVDLQLPVRDGRQHKGPGHVGVIAADQRTEVDLDEVTCGQHRVRRPVMRDRRVRPGRHDRLERHPVGTVVEHQCLQFPAHLALGPAGAQPAAFDQVAQRRVGRLAGQPQQCDLAGILDLAQRFDRARGADQLGRGPRCRLPGASRAQFARQRGEVVDRDDVALEAQPAHPVGGRAPHQGTSARPLNADLHVGRLLRRLGAISPVGRQPGARLAVGVHQQRGVRAGESRQITDVDQVSHQHGVQLGGPQPVPQTVPALRNCHDR
jgi:hypothetical protein